MSGGQAAAQALQRHASTKHTSLGVKTRWAYYNTLTSRKYQKNTGARLHTRKVINLNFMDLMLPIHNIPRETYKTVEISNNFQLSSPR